jgi:hypothetical protein
VPKLHCPNTGQTETALYHGWGAGNSYSSYSVIETSLTEDEGLYFNSMEFYECTEDRDQGTFSLGNEVSNGSVIAGDSTNGVKIQILSSNNDNNNQFQVGGSDTKLNTDFSKNHLTLAITAKEGLRIGNADGPLIAGYKSGESPVSLVRYGFQLWSELILDGFSNFSSDIYPLITAVKGTAASPSLFSFFIKPDDFGTGSLSTLPSDAVFHSVWGGVEDDHTIVYNGLSLSFASSDAVKIEGVATEAGSKAFEIRVTLTDNSNNIEHIDSIPIIIAISENASTPPPPVEITPPSDPGTVIVPSPEPNIVEEVEKAIGGDLVGMEIAEVLPADSSKVKTDESIFANNESIRTFATSVISVNQPVKEGGAVVMAASLTMPLTGRSFTGETQDIPANYTDLQSKYSLYKYFNDGVGGVSEGNAIDLLRIYGKEPDIFGYSAESGLVLNATVVVIDDLAPSGDSNVKAPINNQDVGVKLSRHDDGNNVLYIFDGKKDGNANDPIALVFQKEEQTKSTIAFSHETLELYPDATESVTVTTTPDGGTVTWKSSDEAEDIATIEESTTPDVYDVTAFAPGSVTFTATLEQDTSVTKDLVVTVKAKEADDNKTQSGGGCDTGVGMLGIGFLLSVYAIARKQKLRK